MNADKLTFRVTTNEIRENLLRKSLLGGIWRHRFTFQHPQKATAIVIFSKNTCLQLKIDTRVDIIRNQRW